MVEASLPGRPGLIGRSATLLLAGMLGGCASWLPDSATQNNRTLLYGEFYDANLGNDPARADDLARKLELCGRQLYLKDKGFLTALRQQSEHGEDTSIGEMVALFTEDACKVPDEAVRPAKASDSSRLDATGPATAIPVDRAPASRLARQSSQHC